MAKKLLKVAGIINLVFGGITLLFSLLMFSIGFLRVFGIIGLAGTSLQVGLGGVFLYIAQKDEESFVRSKNLVLALSIISILTGQIINFILGIIAYSQMQPSNLAEVANPIKRELTEEEKVQKKLRNLLALGCGLVLLAGIIFAMTTWETLSGFGKTISLIIATFVFFLMSNFAEKKFNLKSSAITYYILANAFLIFAFVSAGYFNIFGTWFSLSGAGAKLYVSLLWSLGAILAYMAYLKYDLTNLFYIIDFFILLGLIYLLNYFNIGQDIILLIVILSLAIFALIPIKGEVIKRTNNFAKIFLPIASYILFINIASLKLEGGLLFNLISFGIAFVSIYYLAIVNKNVFYEVFAPIFTIGTAFILSTALVTDNKLIFLQFILITLVIYLMGYFKREQKVLFNMTSVVSDFALLYVLIDAINLGYNYYALIAGFVLLGTSIVVSINKSFGAYHFEKILEPVKVILLSYAIYSLTYKFDYSEEALFITLILVQTIIISILEEGDLNFENWFERAK